MFSIFVLVVSQYKKINFEFQNLTPEMTGSHIKVQTKFPLLRNHKNKYTKHTYFKL